VIGIHDTCLHRQRATGAHDLPPNTAIPIRAKFASLKRDCGNAPAS
jgi:hypothetical protein